MDGAIGNVGDTRCGDDQNPIFLRRAGNDHSAG
jgi:hypothetical protein